MRIVGYCTNGDKQYVAFIENDSDIERFKITDGFHDRKVNQKNVEKFNDYKWADKSDIDLQKIYDRMRGARPWHPLLRILRNEVSL